MNRSEKHILRILCVLQVLMITRACFMFFDTDFFGSLTYAIGTCLSLAVVLYFESMLRRHFPIWFKLLIGCGTLFFFVSSLIGKLHDNPDMLKAYCIYLIIIDSTAVLLCLLRNRDELTKIENRLINANIISLILLGPLFITDISRLGLPITLRLGPIGTLLFASIAFSNSGYYQRRGKIVLDILAIMMISAILTAAMTLLFTNSQLEPIVHLFIFFFAYILSMRIYYSTSTKRTKQMIEFMQTVHLASKSSVETFLAELTNLFHQVPSRVVTSGDLRGYDLGAFQQHFRQLNTRCLNYAQLETSAKNKDLSANEKLDVSEQLLSLLQEYDMTHICWLVDTPLTFLLIYLPIIGQNEIIETETNIIAEVTKLIHRSQRG